jgi:HEAT repeat protein
MRFVSEMFRHLDPAIFVLKAIVVAAAANALLLGFILLRRSYRKRYFARRDARVFQFRQQWAAMVSGEVPYKSWRGKAYDRRIVEAIALDGFDAAGPEESARLMKFMRSSGLVEKFIFEARRHRGWRRRRSLVALGRTRALEGIPALGEGLRDENAETRLAALRGLGRTASPDAAEEILTWVGEAGLRVPALPLQSALIQCCAEHPQVLLPYLRYAAGEVREVLGRVLGEVATPALGAELLQFVDDELPELRAAAARGLCRSDPNMAVSVLDELAHDAVWYVRLRAIVSLGQLPHPQAIPSLLHGLTDANRLVRLRAAEALVEVNTALALVFEKVAALRDLYGLHAYVAALEKSGLMAKLEAELTANKWLSPRAAEDLLAVLRTGSPLPQLPAQPPAAEAHELPAGVASGQ